MGALRVDTGRADRWCARSDEHEARNDESPMSHSRLKHRACQQNCRCGRDVRRIPSYIRECRRRFAAAIANDRQKSDASSAPRQLERFVQSADFAFPWTTQRRNEMVRLVRGGTVGVAIGAAVAIAALSAAPAAAATGRQLEADARAALQQLYATQPSAKVLGSKAKAILVFPDIVKAGFMFGGQLGEGVRFENGKVRGYYSSVAASYGLQAGIQRFGYALFFMDRNALRQLDATRGFELGVGPSIVVVDEGMGKSFTTNTLTSDVYAYIFDQRGLMAGLGIQGSKISRIDQ
jgi:lipid-binding SYLF domain-containing protein